jgi:hypothetical protein
VWHVCAAARSLSYYQYNMALKGHCESQSTRLALELCCRKHERVCVWLWSRGPCPARRSRCASCDVQDMGTTPTSTVPRSCTSAAAAARTSRRRCSQLPRSILPSRPWQQQPGDSGYAEGAENILSAQSQPLSGQRVPSQTKELAEHS